jgi:hypothetical protein
MPPQFARIGVESNRGVGIEIVRPAAHRRSNPVRIATPQIIRFLLYVIGAVTHVEPPPRFHESPDQVS